MKRTITLTVEIDCEKRYCGRCDSRDGALCLQFGAKLLTFTAAHVGHMRKAIRLPECRAAEVAKP